MKIASCDPVKSIVPHWYLFSGLQNCHQIIADTTIEFAISGGLKARNVIAWAEASHASEAQVESAHET
jgi:hypothetical protein